MFTKFILYENLKMIKLFYKTDRSVVMIIHNNNRNIAEKCNQEILSGKRDKQDEKLLEKIDEFVSTDSYECPLVISRIAKLEGENEDDISTFVPTRQAVGRPGCFNPESLIFKDLDLDLIREEDVKAPDSKKKEIASKENKAVAKDIYKNTSKFAERYPIRAELARQKGVNNPEAARVIPTRQYADYAGRFNHIALSYSTTYDGETREQIFDAYRTMFKNMEPDTKFTIAIDKKDDATAFEKMIKDNDIPNPERIEILRTTDEPYLFYRDDNDKVVLNELKNNIELDGYSKNCLKQENNPSLIIGYKQAINDIRNEIGTWPDSDKTNVNDYVEFKGKPFLVMQDENKKIKATELGISPFTGGLDANSKQLLKNNAGKQCFVMGTSNYTPNINSFVEQNKLGINVITHPINEIMGLHVSFNNNKPTVELLGYEQKLELSEKDFENIKQDKTPLTFVGSDDQLADLKKFAKKQDIIDPDKITHKVRNKSPFLPLEGGPTIWARDMLVSADSRENPSLSYMINTDHSHSRDGYLPPQFAAHFYDSSVDLMEENLLVTDGGDVLSTKKDSIVGHESVLMSRNNLLKYSFENEDFNKWAVKHWYNKYDRSMENASPDTMTIAAKIALDEKANFDSQVLARSVIYEDLAVDLFEEHFGKPVTVVGKDDPETKFFEEPLAFHQDMCITPIDDNTIMLGDPELFDELLEKMTPEERKHADKQIAEISGLNIKDGMAVMDKFTKDSQYIGNNKPENYKAYEKALKDKGYNIVKLPYRCSDEHMFPSFTYNNCLTENFEKDGEQVRRVFLPIVGVDYFDDYAVKTYEEQGFEVHTIKMPEVIKMSGALRCITNWLERSEQA
jgi:hypothetical protein